MMDDFDTGPLARFAEREESRKTRQRIKNSQKTGRLPDPCTVADVEKVLVGRRVILCGTHPYAGKTGECVGVCDTYFGKKPIVRLDEGGETCVMNPNEWRPIKCD